MAEIPLSDIQGFVMRTYAMPAMRVFALKVEDAPLAARFLGSLISGDPATPQLATAAPWSTKPDYCVNIAFTRGGLAAMQVPPASLATFPEDFVEGAVARAPRVGDTDASAPIHWKGGLGSDDVHALVFVFAQSEPLLESVSARLRTEFATGPAFAEISAHDGRALPNNVAHFGYRDGFAQPTIAGGLPPSLPDTLPPAPPGEFLLGRPSQYEGFTYPVPEPADQLGRNGSFVAFRILAQDCHGFEQFLAEAGRQTGLDPELIAAKLCGRWRNGVPLALSPETPDVDLPLEKYNSFDYVPTDAVPDAVDDRRGYRCPIGSHIRRMNPRHSAVAGNSGLKRRIVRRGLPYGPPYDAQTPNDGIERGLLGVFIGVSLKDQFEFLMSDWANRGSFAPGLRDTRDPVIGDNSSGVQSFLVPVEGRKAVELTGLSRFVLCRGSAYCFLPSVTAIRYLSTLAAAQPAAATV
jgi:deferrochelatase/peroxidase EfeB